MLKLSVILCVCATSIMIHGCSGDDSGPNPVTSVGIAPGEVDVDLGHSASIAATVKGGENKDVTWYVNDIENGNQVYGTITGNRTGTYTAPDSLPAPSTVVVKAVSVEDTTKSGTCTVNVIFKKVFIDPVDGSDLEGNGSLNLPFKTITHASGEARPGMTVFAQAGVYSEASGEIFPIGVRADSVVIEGMDWEQCIIRGHDKVYSFHTIVALGGYTGASFRKFTLEQGLPADDVQVALYIGGTDTHLDSIRVFERADYAVCRAENVVRPVIENCEFIVDDGLALQRGLNVFNNSSGGIVRNCTFTGFYTGLRITNTSDLLVEGCTLEGNGVAVEAWLEDSPNSLNPDFGGGARGSLGGNVIRNNSECGLWFDLPHPIYARYNTWGNNPPVPGEDYCRMGDGDLILE